MKQVRISNELVQLEKGDKLIGKRSGKIFEITCYEVSPWGHTTFHILAEDGERRKVASFILGKKYDLFYDLYPKL